MNYFETDFNGISPDMGEIYRNMGYGTYTPDKTVGEALGAALEEAAKVCRPRFGYEILPVEAVTDREISIAGKTLATGRIIIPFFKRAEYIAVFVATAGQEFDLWMKGRKTGGDVFSEFIADVIGSEIAEAAGRLLSGMLEIECAVDGMAISNSYSPGYCGWNIREQTVLFSLLPASPCGVTLTDSCLMLPIKSISGIIGIGKEMKKAGYSCEICDRTSCYKKR